MPHWMREGSEVASFDEQLARLGCESRIIAGTLSRRRSAARSHGREREGEKYNAGRITLSRGHIDLFAIHRTARATH